VIQEHDSLSPNRKYVHYTERFTDWLTVKSRFRIDSLAVMQVEPINTLEDLVNSMKIAFVNAVNAGMVAVKVNVAYTRTLDFDKVPLNAARKVFHHLTNGDERVELSFNDAKPLQDGKGI
jgi:hypothetical protein